MEYRALGTLELRDGERSIPLAGAKQRSLLALLLVNANRVVSRDRLIDELWGARPPATVVQSLQVYVSRLRRLLPPDTLLTRPPGYLLAITPDELDLQRFERLLAAGREALAAGNPESASTILREALALWRGPVLGEFAHESFAQAEIVRLEDLRLVALEERLEADLALGRHPDLIGELQALIAENPHRERLRGQLMLALYRSGRQAEALEAYRAAWRALVDERGIEPSAALQRLEKQILTHDERIEARLGAVPVPPPMLPIPVTPFLGRERELAEVTAFLRRADVRLLTLTGPGGIGKTRLALHAAGGELADGFPDGVSFVSLAAVSDAAILEPSVAQTLGVEDVHLYLRSKRLLLLLDNLEQIPSAAAKIGDLMAAAPGVRVLATSRERLGIAAEQEYVVPVLSLEDGIALFTERARRLQPSFEPDAHVANIVERLDGVPLALELAAARVKVLTPEQISERLSDGFDLLAGGARDAPERQRTLRATLEWSHGLLTEAERQAFARLGVFARGFDLEALEAVTGVGLDTLNALVDKSLVGTDGTGRLVILDVILRFARERLELLPEHEELRRRHAEYYIRLSIRASGAGLRTRDEAAKDVDNFRAAAEWARSRNEPALLVTAAEGWHEMRVTAAEAASWFDAAFAHAARLEPAARVRALSEASIVHRDAGDFALSRSFAEQALTEARALRDESLELRILRSLGVALSALGDLESARDNFEQSLALAERLGDFQGVARALHAAGENERRIGNLDRSRELLERAIEIARRTSDPRTVAPYALHGLGDTELVAGELERAARLYRDALVEFDRAGDERSAMYVLAGLAAVAATDGHPERAGVLWGVAAAQEEAAGIRVQDYDRMYEEALTRVAGPAYAAAFERGRTMPHDEAVTYALGTSEFSSLS